MRVFYIVFEMLFESSGVVSCESVSFVSERKFNEILKEPFSVRYVFYLSFQCKENVFVLFKITLPAGNIDDFNTKFDLGLFNKDFSLFLDSVPATRGAGLALREHSFDSAFRKIFYLSD